MKYTGVDVRDVGEVIAVLSHRSKEFLYQTINVTSNETLSFRETLDILGKVRSDCQIDFKHTGMEYKHAQTAPENIEGALNSMHYHPTVSKAMIEIFQEVDKGSFSVVSSAIEDILSRPPRTFDQYAKDFNHIYRFPKVRPYEDESDEEVQ